MRHVLGATGTVSCFSSGKTSRNQPTYPVIASNAPRTLTEALVTSPVKTKATPNAAQRGHAVGAGIASAAGRLLLLIGRKPTGSCASPLSANEVDNAEDDDPHRIHEVPIDREHVHAVGVLLLDASRGC